jgi:cardiolipin synthase
VPGLGIVDSPALPGWGDAPAALGIWFVYVGIAFSLGTAVQYTIRAGRLRRSIRTNGLTDPAEKGTP